MSLPVRISHANEHADPVDVFLFGFIPFVIFACGIGAIILDIISGLLVWMKG